MDIQEIRKHIPHGYGKVIADRASVSQRSVSLVLTGKRKSHHIEMVALAVASELIEKRKKLEEVIMS